MGFRFTIPLPGPFSYSVSPPRLGRALRHAARRSRRDRQEQKVLHEIQELRREIRGERCSEPRRAQAKPKLPSHAELTRQLEEMRARHREQNAKLRAAGIPLDESLARLIESE